MMGYGYDMWGFGIIIPILFIALIVYVVIRLSQGNQRQYVPHKDGNNALDILNERYAKGEISEEEYIKMKNMLKD